MVWLKVELCRMLEEKRSATLRSVYISSPVSHVFVCIRLSFNKAPEGTFFSLNMKSMQVGEEKKIQEYRHLCQTHGKFLVLAFFFFLILLKMFIYTPSTL